jgi:hypothetical protein
MSPPFDRRYDLSLSSSLFRETLGKKDMTSKPRLNVSICTSRPLPLLFLIFEPGGLFPDDPLSREKGFVRHESLLHPLLISLREGDRVDGLWIGCGMKRAHTFYQKNIIAGLTCTTILDCIKRQPRLTKTPLPLCRS